MYIKFNGTIQNIINLSTHLKCYQTKIFNILHGKCRNDSHKHTKKKRNVYCIPAFRNLSNLSFLSPHFRSRHVNACIFQSYISFHLSFQSTRVKRCEGKFGYQRWCVIPFTFSPVHFRIKMDCLQNSSHSRFLLLFDNINYGLQMGTTK